MKLVLIICLLIFRHSIFAQDLNFKTNVFQSKYSDLTGSTANHTGYSFGVDVVIPDGSTVIIPGIHFQKTSILPAVFDITRPYKNFVDVQSIKVPFQIGVFPFKSKWAAWLHGGVAATYLVGLDENSTFNEDDLHDLRGAILGGISARIFFISAHIGYEHGFSRIYLNNNPSGINDKSKERIWSFGLGVYF